MHKFPCKSQENLHLSNEKHVKLNAFHKAFLQIYEDEASKMSSCGLLYLCEDSTECNLQSPVCKYFWLWSVDSRTVKPSLCWLKRCWITCWWSNYFIFHVEENITVVPRFTAELARVLNIHFIELTLGSMHDVIVFCCKSVYTVFGTDVKTLNVRKHKNACIKFGRFTAGNAVASS